MYDILVINETGVERYGREYNAFMSALCLARMGHRVLYLGNFSFAAEFYEGGYIKDVDPFDLKPPETSASLPVGFTIEDFHKLDTAALGQPRIPDVIDRWGGHIDIVAYSGNEFIASFTEQIARKYRAGVLKLDIGSMPPCVNEVQLRRVDMERVSAGRRIVMINNHIDGARIETIREHCAAIDDYEIWLIGRLIQPLPVDKLVEQRVFIQEGVTDYGRFKILKASAFYINVGSPTEMQGIAEALCIGLPVASLRYSLASELCGDMISYLDNDVIRRAWIEGWQRDSSELLRKARNKYGVSNRIAFLHNLIKDMT